MMKKVSTKRVIPSVEAESVSGKRSKTTKSVEFKENLEKKKDPKRKIVTKSPKSNEQPLKIPIIDSDDDDDNSIDPKQKKKPKPVQEEALVYCPEKIENMFNKSFDQYKNLESFDDLQSTTDNDLFKDAISIIKEFLSSRFKNQNNENDIIAHFNSLICSAENIIKRSLYEFIPSGLALILAKLKSDLLNDISKDGKEKSVFSFFHDLGRLRRFTDFLVTGIPVTSGELLRTKNLVSVTDNEDEDLSSMETLLDILRDKGSKNVSRNVIATIAKFDKFLTNSSLTQNNNESTMFTIGKLVTPSGKDKGSGCYNCFSYIGIIALYCSLHNDATEAKNKAKTLLKDLVPMFEDCYYILKPFHNEELLKKKTIIYDILDKAGLELVDYKFPVQNYNQCDDTGTSIFKPWTATYKLANNDETIIIEDINLICYSNDTDNSFDCQTVYDYTLAVNHSLILVDQFDNKDNRKKYTDDTWVKITGTSENDNTQFKFNTLQLINPDTYKYAIENGVFTVLDNHNVTVNFKKFQTDINGFIGSIEKSNFNLYCHFLSLLTLVFQSSDLDVLQILQSPELNDALNKFIAKMVEETCRTELEDKYALFYYISDEILKFKKIPENIGKKLPDYFEMPLLPKEGEVGYGNEEVTNKIKEDIALQLAKKEQFEKEKSEVTTKKYNLTRVFHRAVLNMLCLVTYCEKDPEKKAVPVEEELITDMFENWSPFDKNLRTPELKEQESEFSISLCKLLNAKLLPIQRVEIINGYHEKKRDKVKRSQNLAVTFDFDTISMRHERQSKSEALLKLSGSKQTLTNETNVKKKSTSRRRGGGGGGGGGRKKSDKEDFIIEKILDYRPVTGTTINNLDLLIQFKGFNEGEWQKYYGNKTLLEHYKVMDFLRTSKTLTLMLDKEYQNLKVNEIINHNPKRNIKSFAGLKFKVGYAFSNITELIDFEKLLKSIDKSTHPNLLVNYCTKDPILSNIYNLHFNSKDLEIKLNAKNNSFKIAIDTICNTDKISSELKTQLMNLKDSVKSPEGLTSPLSTSDSAVLGASIAHIQNFDGIGDNLDWLFMHALDLTNTKYNSSYFVEYFKKLKKLFDNNVKTWNNTKIALSRGNKKKTSVCNEIIQDYTNFSYSFDGVDNNRSVLTLSDIKKMISTNNQKLVAEVYPIFINSLVNILNIVAFDTETLTDVMVTVDLEFAKTYLMKSSIGKKDIEFENRNLFYKLCIAKYILIPFQNSICNILLQYNFINDYCELEIIDLSAGTISNKGVTSKAIYEIIDEISLGFTCLFSNAKCRKRKKIIMKEQSCNKQFSSSSDKFNINEEIFQYSHYQINLLNSLLSLALLSRCMTMQSSYTETPDDILEANIESILNNPAAASVLDNFNLVVAQYAIYGAPLIKEDYDSDDNNEKEKVEDEEVGDEDFELEGKMIIIADEEEKEENIDDGEEDDEEGKEEVIEEGKKGDIDEGDKEEGDEEEIEEGKKGDIKEGDEEDIESEDEEKKEEVLEEGKKGDIDEGDEEEGDEEEIEEEEAEIDNDAWTEEKCLEEALKYQIEPEFKDLNKQVYEIAKNNKWLEQCCSHMKTKAQMHKDIKQYESAADFNILNKNLYKLLEKYNWLSGAKYTAASKKQSKPSKK